MVCNLFSSYRFWEENPGAEKGGLDPLYLKDGFHVLDISLQHLEGIHCVSCLCVLYMLFHYPEHHEISFPFNIFFSCDSLLYHRTCQLFL